MEDQIQMMAKELDCSIVYRKMEKRGYAFFPPAADGHAFIAVNNQLTESHQTITILHELGHVAKQRNNRELYDASMTMKLKMEREANEFLITGLVQNYVDITGNNPINLNYIDFMRNNDIPSCEEDLVKEIIWKFDDKETYAN